MSKIDGFILLHKEPGVTSFEALRPIKKLLGKGVKVGHCGTLDKFAEGLMIVLVGSFTRLNQLFSGLDKEYWATITFGRQTATLDPEGEVIATAPLPLEQPLTKVVNQFTGRQQQVPPAYSAIHVDGKRAYERVLAGEEPELKPRGITIYRSDIHHLKFNENIQFNAAVVEEATLQVICSKGTYIRSLARDIGLACGSAAYCCALKRTKIGNYTADYNFDEGGYFGLEDAVKANQLTLNAIKMPSQLINYLPVVNLVIKDEFVKAVKCGNIFKEDWVLSKKLNNLMGWLPLKDVLLFDNAGNFLAAAYKEQDGWRYYFVKTGE
ncbi:MAG: tRNA pseudouridine(55) synthase TruB [Spirochaetaceae bacterium]|nr:tRNA pseudouridine(55) synthase TruB [Spirochaetaceae bacterium]